MVEKFQSLSKSRHRFHAGDAMALEQRVIETIGSRERRGVAHRNFCALLGAASFERDHRFLVLAGNFGGTGESGNIFQAFNVQADGGDAIILRQCFQHARHIHIGLVADGKQRSQRKGTVAHAEIAGDIS